MSRVAELAARRAEIVEHSSLLRARMIECGRDFGQSMAGVERAVSTVRTAASKPLLLAAVAGVLVLLTRPRRLVTVASRGLFMVGLVKQVGQFIAYRRKKKRLRFYPPARLAG